MSDVTIAAASACSARDVAAFLSREHPALAGGEEPSDAPSARGFVALAGGVLVGIVLGSEVPAVDPARGYVFPAVVVEPARRRQGIGRRLVDALCAMPSARPSAWAVVTPLEGDTETPKFLRAVGFEVLEEAVMYARDTAATPARPTRGLTLARYDGAARRGTPRSRSFSVARAARGSARRISRRTRCAPGAPR